MQIPNIIMIPGAKLGLANIVIVVVLYQYGLKESSLINLLRIVIINTIFGSIISFTYAFVGGFLSLLLMYFLKKCNKFSYSFVSIIGGLSHNIGQIIVAIVITNTKELLYYLPMLIDVMQLVPVRLLFQMLRDFALLRKSVAFRDLLACFDILRLL